MNLEEATFTPCKCSGSLKIHKDCLMTWLNSKHEWNDDNNSIRCEVCLQAYNVTIKKKSKFQIDRNFLETNKSELFYLALSVILFLLVTASLILLDRNLGFGEVDSIVTIV